LPTAAEIENGNQEGVGPNSRFGSDHSRIEACFNIYKFQGHMIQNMIKQWEESKIESNL